MHVAFPDTQGLQKPLVDGVGDRFMAGFVVHTGGDAHALSDRIWAVPIHQLWTG